MNKKLILFLSLAIFAGCQPEITVPEDYVSVQIGGENILAEVADDSREREQGLMYRENLPENQGMFFVFSDMAQRTFWMKNTLIPLDIIYISDTYRVVSISTVYPCKADRCEVYSSNAPARFVLEVKAGFAEEHSVGVGDKVRLLES